MCPVLTGFSSVFGPHHLFYFYILHMCSARLYEASQSDTYVGNNNRLLSLPKASANCPVWPVQTSLLLCGSQVNNTVLVCQTEATLSVTSHVMAPMWQIGIPQSWVCDVTGSSTRSSQVACWQTEKEWTCDKTDYQLCFWFLFFFIWQMRHLFTLRSDCSHTNSFISHQVRRYTLKMNIFSVHVRRREKIGLSFII